MDLSLWTLIYVLVMKINQIYALSPCQASLPTVVSVSRCPRNKAEWESQSKKKKCSKVSQSCVKPEEFLYHCLINEYMNMTIEVCAPSVPILGQKCAEFNTVGAVVQDNEYAKCNDSNPPCPFRYNSTNVYKYQRCYSYINSTINVLPNCPDNIRDKTLCSCDRTVWLAFSIVFIILFLISCGLGGIVLYKYRNLPPSTPSQTPEVVPFLSEGEDRAKPDQEIAKDTSGVPHKPEDEGIFKAVQEVDQEKSANKTDEENFWVFSIYFGDKYCGMAYLDPNSPEDIISLGDHEIIGVLITKDGEVIEFGDKARKMFTNNEQDCRDYIFLDHDELNMEFWNDPVSTPDSIKVIEVYQNIIGFLVRKIYKKITGNDSKAQEEMSCESGSCVLCNMHCVITVPHHWDSEKRIKKLRAAFDKTMKDLHKNVKEERLHIKLREVAISPYIHEVKASVTCLNFNVDNLTFNEETACVNLHVGSKYCNLTFLKSGKSQSPDKIIGVPNRQKWKSTPEDRFVKLFEYIFKTNIFNEWKAKYEREYISLLCLLEDRKNKMRENMDDNEKYEFPFSSNLFKPFVKDESEMTHLRKRAKEKKGEVEMKDGVFKLIFKWSTLKNFFDHVKESTKDIIQEHQKDFVANKVRCVIMTGSYSQMKLFLHEAEKEWFKDLSSTTVVIPVHIGSTYAIGAAYFFNKYPKWISYDLMKK